MSRPDPAPHSPVAQLRALVGDSMKAGNRIRTDTLRMLLAAVNKIRMDSGNEPDQAQLVAAAEKMIKQRRESAQLYSQAGRTELAQKENDEIAILQEFLPEQLGEQEITQLIRDAVNNPDLQGNIGKIMGQLKSQIAGKADMAQVAQKVKSALQ